MPQAIPRPWPALRRSQPRRLVPALLLLTVALCLVPTEPSYADPPPADSPDFAAIDAYIAQEMRDVRIPGLALGIVHNDEVVHLGGLGVADDSGRVVTPQTPFILASASNTIAVAIALALPHSGIAPLLSIAAPVLGFAIPVAVLVAGFLLLRKGADFDKARPTAQRPTMEPRVEASHRQ